uniref:HAD family hydrolase n=1 Tax=Cyanothece sp. BG0011 TaxID=2082950 RepID=UPI001E510BDD|nr:HAD hydrolase-like protein [Cyanothece sp. BG0011]
MYIGDETRDINSAKKSHVKSVGVTWGFNSSEALEKEKPDFLINHPHELITILDHYQYNILDDSSKVNRLII